MTAYDTLPCAFGACVTSMIGAPPIGVRKMVNLAPRLKAEMAAVTVTEPL